MFDLVIVGGGTAGLSSAVYACRENLNFVLVEETAFGGQIVQSQRVDNYLGLYGESGFELASRFHHHAKSVGTQFINAKVIDILYSENFFIIKLSNNTVIETKTVIIAAGAVPRKLSVDGEDKLVGKGVSFCATCDGIFFRDRNVAVVGGGDTALHEALFLSKIAKKVYLIHRRDKFRAAKNLTDKIAECDNLQLILNAKTINICGEEKVKSLIYIQNETENEIEVDGVFVAIGYTPNSDLVKNLCELDGNGYIIADETGKTSFSGLFAAGDIRTKQMRQLITAASDGANCVSSVISYLSHE